MLLELLITVSIIIIFVCIVLYFLLRDTIMLYFNINTYEVVYNKIDNENYSLIYKLLSEQDVEFSTEFYATDDYNAYLRLVFTNTPNHFDIRISSFYFGLNRFSNMLSLDKRSFNLKLCDCIFKSYGVSKCYNNVRLPSVINEEYVLKILFKNYKEYYKGGQ